MGGNVLVGTTTDSGYKLDVNGTGRYSSTLTIQTAASDASPSNSILISTSSSGNGGRISWGDSNTSILRYSNSLYFREYTGNFRFESTGSGAALLHISEAVTTLFSGRFITSGSTTATSALARGVYFNNTLVAAANNDVLVGLDINPTFTNGAFTGVANLSIRGAGWIQANGGFAVGSSAYSGGIPINGLTISGAAPAKYYVGSGGGFSHSFRTASNDLIGERLRITDAFTAVLNGNLLVNTTTDAGYKLDVAGTGRFTGNLTVSTGGVGTNTFNANVNYLFANQNNVYGLVDLQNAAGQNVFLKVTGTPTAGTGFDYFWISGTTTSSTVGTTRNIFNVSPTYNLTGAFTGIMRGFYYNPTLTSMTGATHRAIETTSGDVVFGAGAPKLILQENVASINTPSTLSILFGQSTTPGYATGLFSVATAEYNRGTLILAASPNTSNNYNVQESDKNIQLYGTSTQIYKPIYLNNRNLFFVNNTQNTNTLSMYWSHAQTKVALFSNSLGSYGRGDFRIALLNTLDSTTVSTTDTRFMVTGDTYNVLIGTTTDNGYKLQVNGGGAFVKGSGTTSSTTSLLLQNSNGNDIFRVNDSGTITVSRSGSGVYKDVLVNTDGTAIIGSMSNDYIYFGGGFSQTYLISSGYLNILGAYLRGNSTQGNNKIAFNYVVDLNAYGNTSLPLVFNKYAGTVTFQAAGSANIHQTEVNLNFDGGGGGPRTLRAYYYNPTFVQGPQSYDRHYAWQNTLGAMIVNSSTPQDSAILQADSTTQGFLAPRMTTAQKNAITSPATGLEVYDSTTNTPNYFNGTTWVGVASNQSTGLSPGLFSQTSDSVAVTNTTVESSLISTGVGTLSVPANGFQVGAAYIAYLSGVMSSQNNATMEIHLRSNGFILADTDPMILSATTGKFWELHVNFVIRAIGGGGVAAIVTSGRFSYNKDSGNIPESLGFSGVNNTTFDTTINNTLTVTATWGNASPSNSIQTRIFNLYRVY
jgi:hypothetical protein